MVIAAKSLLQHVHAELVVIVIPKILCMEFLYALVSKDGEEKIAISKFVIAIVQLHRTEYVKREKDANVNMDILD